MTEVGNQESVAVETAQVADGPVESAAAPLLGSEAPTTEVTTETQDWRSSLPEDLRGNTSLGSINSVEDLAKSYVSAQQLIGKKVEDMTPEQIEQFQGQKNIPAEANQYKLGTMPEGADQNLVDWFKGTAKEAGLTEEQASTIFEKYNEMGIEGQKMTESQSVLEMESQVKELKAEFGPAFDERVALAQKAVHEFGGEELKTVLAESGLGNHPELVKAFAKAGMLVSEGGLQAAEQSGSFGMTTAEIDNKIAELRSDPGFDQRLRSNEPGIRDVATKQLTDLYALKHGVAQ
jgi:hypothetical protein